MYMYIDIYVCYVCVVYIYILSAHCLGIVYIVRGRYLQQWCMHVFIYIYIMYRTVYTCLQFPMYMHTCMCIYIYMDMSHVTWNPRCLLARRINNPRVRVILGSYYIKRTCDICIVDNL